MKEKRECKVVQDLLPNYVEKLTNEETNKYIEEHIENCEECKNVLESMRNEIKVPDIEKQKKEVKFLKKYNRKIKILSGIILAIFIIYGVFVIRNVVILSSIVNKTNQVWNSNNMHITIYSHSGGTFSIVDGYYLDGKYLTKMTRYESNTGIVKMVGYNDENKNEMYVEQGGNKVAFVNSNPMKVIITPHIYFTNPFELIFIASFSKITSAECNGEKCYYVDSLGEYFSKKTGLSVRASNGVSTTSEGTFNALVDYKYEFGTVKEEDFILPDISEYQIIEEN